MRKLVFGFALLAIALIAVPALAEEGTFTSDGDVRMRWDMFGNYLDANDDGATNDSYDVFPYRARLGVTGQFTDVVWGRVELQAAGWFGDGASSTMYPYPTLGGLSSPDDGTVQLYQAFVTIDGSTWDFTAGRKEHVVGNELMIGDNDFYNGLVFDGIYVDGDFSSWDLTLFWNQLNETDVAREDTSFMGAYADFELGSTTLEPYILFVKSFDSTLGGPFSLNNLELWTFGVNWQKPINEERRGWDLNVELAGQSGESGPSGTKIDHKGFIFEGWFGWGFGGGGRIHIGYLLASGDDGTSLTESDAFIPLFEDPHANNRLGNLDLFAGFTNAVDGGASGMSNIQDISAGYNWWGGEKHHILAAVHSFTRPEVASGANDDIGIEFDIAYDYRYADNMMFEIGAGFLSPGDYVKDMVGNDDMISRIWAQVHLNWGK